MITKGGEDGWSKASRVVFSSCEANIIVTQNKKRDSFLDTRYVYIEGPKK